MRGEVRGLHPRKACRGSTREIYTAVVSGSYVRFDDESGDPFTLGERQSVTLRVVDNLVITLVGPVLERPTTVVLVTGFYLNGEIVRTNKGGLVTRIASRFGILRGPRAGDCIFPASMQGGISGVVDREDSGVTLVPIRVRPAAASLVHRPLGVTLGEAVRNLDTLGELGLRVVQDLGGDGRLVGDHVVERDRTLGVLHSDS